jgi:hypothetical protein
MNQEKPIPSPSGPEEIPAIILRGFFCRCLNTSFLFALVRGWCFPHLGLGFGSDDGFAGVHGEIRLLASIELRRWPISGT